jgi:uncharacterized protein YggL (DUF469 family)
MRQREKNNVRLSGELVSIRLNEFERLGFGVAGEFREHAGERLPRTLARGDGDQFRMRMVQQQFDKFFAGVTGRPNDGDFLHSHDFVLTQRRRNAEKNIPTKNPAGLNQRGLKISRAINAC